MTTCGWTLVGIGIIAVFAFPTIFLCLKSHLGCCEYWREDWWKVKCFNNEGLILPSCNRLFFILEHLSLIIIIRKCIEKQGGLCFKQRQYRATDIYTLVWFTILFVIFMLSIFSDCVITLPPLYLAIISYRLFDIFQFWVNEYILGKIHSQPPVNMSRTLILNFINYGEITLSFSLIAFIQSHLFDGIDCMTQAFYYSIRNAITIGSSDVTPIGFWGHTIFAFQLLFVLLFLTVVVSNIIGYKKKD